MTSSDDQFQRTFDRMEIMFIIFGILFVIAFLFVIGFMTYSLVMRHKMLKKGPELMDATIEEKKASTELKKSVKEKGVNVNITKKDKEDK
jgi:hypothetical protein